LDDDMEASMTRAQVDLQSDLSDLLPVVHALAQYLQLRCNAADPNPSGHVARSDPKKAARAVAADPAPTTAALIPDAEYTVKQAVEITRRKEITLRKMLQDGRLPSRMNEETRRRMIQGRDLARFMARQDAEEPEQSPATKV
jgi:hypothetical protein